MAERRSPSVRGRQLARELRLLRAADGRTGEEIGALLQWSSAKISRIETARTAITTTDLRKLLDVYGVTGDPAEKLLVLARTANVRGWWDAYSDFDYNYTTLIGLEAEAVSLHCYSALSLHGFLQTEDYARQIIGTRPVIPPGEVERLTQVRLRRQSRLTGAQPLEFSAVLDEAAIRRQVGGPDVMRTQLRHLIDVAAQPNVTLQILPFSAGVHPGMAGTFIVLRFPFPGNEIVYLELMNSSLYVEQEVDVYKYSMAFDDLRGRALDPEKSIDYITQAITELQL
jgi:transcriptional regulator with XRE-family HTH domain